jgi:hypothetical protein
MAIWSITHFKILPNYKIEVSFADGTSGIADLAPRLSQGPLGDGFDPVCDEKIFSQAFLEHGALTWPGGIDLAPDAMYQRIRLAGTSVLAAKSKRVAWPLIHAHSRPCNTECLSNAYATDAASTIRMD